MHTTDREDGVAYGHFGGCAPADVFAVNDHRFMDSYELPRRQPVFKIFERYPRHEPAVIV